jgi:hypothetical protein
MPKKEGTFCHLCLVIHSSVGIRFSSLVRALRFQYLLVRFFMPERIQKPAEPAPWGPKQGDGGGPRSPDISRPDTKDLLKKMRKVDPNQSKRYRQRTGQ